MTTWIERWSLPAGDGPVVAVKDLIDVAGSVTTAGCKALLDTAEPASRDAPCILAVRAAGGRLAGKTNLHELAFGTTGVNPWFGTPANPADPGRVPGGSSSGSAVAVADSEADVALGSDTGGSVRIPAACCGVVGLKTTHGLVSLEGVWPLAPSYDTVGVLARDVAATVVGMALLGCALPDAGTLPDTVGLAVLPAEIADRIDPIVAGAMLPALASAGLRSEPVPVPSWYAAWVAHQKLLLAEAWSSDGHLVEGPSAAGVSPDVQERLRIGTTYSAAELEEALSLRSAFTSELSAAVGRFDLLALPTLPTRPPVVGETTWGFNCLTAPVNFAGFPAISVPVPVAEQGRPPTGLQLVGAPGTEGLLCAVAAVIEAAVTS